MITASATLIAVILVINIFLISLSAFIIYAYVRLSSRYTNLDTKLKRDEAGREKIRSEILHDSYKSAQDVILSAKRRAEQIVKDAEFFKKDQGNSFQKALDQVSNQQIEIYQNTLKDIKDDTHLMFEGLLTETTKLKDEQLSQLLNHLETEVGEATKSYKAEVTSLTENLKKSFEAEHESVKDELREYREMMTARLDESIVDVVREVVTEVVSSGISLKDREDMVIQSLTQAKKKFGINVDANQEEKSPKYDK